MCRTNGSPTFTTFGNQVRELLPSVRMKQWGQYLLLARRLRTVQNICSGHSILFSIIHLSCWKYSTIENIYYFLNFLFFVFNGISKGYIYNIFEWKQLLFKFNTVECLSTLTIKLKHFKFADQILGNYSRTLVWLFHWK